jgi:hypothetical protein
MSQFVRTREGHINLANVVRIKPDEKPRNEEGNADLWYTEQGKVMVTRAFLRGDLAEITAPLVPAAPGHSVVTIEQDPPHAIQYLDVIAWRIEGDIAWPVVAGEPQVNELSSDWGILHPSAAVVEVMGMRHDSAEEFQRFVAEKYAARKQALMSSAAQFTFAEYTSHGWTEEQLVLAGLMKRERAT